MEPWRTSRGAADVSRLLLHRYFRDKAELYAVVVEPTLTEWDEVLRAEAQRNGPGTAHTLRLVLPACLDFAHSRRVLRKLLARDSRMLLASYSDVIELSNELLRELVREVLAGGLHRGSNVRASLDLDDVAHVVSEAFIAHSDHVVAGETQGLGERRVSAIIETLLHGVIAKRPGRTAEAP